MDWNKAETEVAGCILRLQEDALAQARAGEDFALIELRANAVAARAHAEGECCRQRGAFDVEEIARLQMEQA